MKTISIDELQNLNVPADSKLNRAYRMHILQYDSDYYDKFISLLHEHLEEAFNDLNKDRKHLQGDSEDRLSVSVIGILNVAGFEATHDTQTGGHCDIYVKYKKTIWVGEAKKISSNQQAYIKQGLLQLTERYASGIKYQTEGAIVIYCFAPDAQKVLTDLSDKLKGDDYQVKDKEHPHDLHFKASKKHVGTGNTYNVTSYIVPLHHNPPV